MKPFSLHRIVLPLLLLLVAVISTNLAWLNPTPGEPPSMRPLPRIPFMWQYDNSDAPNNFQAAARFPEYFRQSPARVERPATLLVVNLIAETYHTLASPFYAFSPFPTINLKGEKSYAYAHVLTMGEGLQVVTTLLGYLTLKLLLFGMGMVAAFQLFSRYVERTTALAGVWILFFHPFSLYSFSLFPVMDLEFITPIYIAWFLMRITDLEQLGRPATKTVLGYSVLVGILMLAKPNYAAYVAALGFGFFHGRFRWVFLSAGVHLLPLLLWLGYIDLIDIPYFSKAVTTHGQGVWMVQLLNNPDTAKGLLLIWANIKYFMGHMAQFHSLWQFAAMAGLLILLHKKQNRTIYFLLLFHITLVLQALFANRYFPYMSADFWFVTVGLAMLAWQWVTPKLPNQMVKPTLAMITLAWSVHSIMSWYHTPWVHPLQQAGLGG
ncbi:MAG: hypothetical protein HQL52_07760 [Magnetococcales bacterium]|nr:hypothetical protein [Magnetococcales bacterium]